MPSTPRRTSAPLRLLACSGGAAAAFVASLAAGGRSQFAWPAALSAGCLAWLALAAVLLLAKEIR